MSSLSLYLRLLHYVRPYRGVFGAALVAMLVVAGGDVALVKISQFLIDSFGDTSGHGRVIWPAALVAAFALRGIASWAADYGVAWVGQRVVFDLRRELGAHVVRLPTPFYDEHSAGNLISKVTFDPQNLSSAASSVIASSIKSALSIAAIGALLIYENWKLTLIAVVVFPFVAVTTRYFSRRLRRLSRAQQEAMGGLTHSLEEAVAANRVVKVFGGQAYEEGRIATTANALRRAYSKHAAAAAASGPIAQTMLAVVVAVIIYTAIAQTQEGVVTLGGFTAYVLGMLRLLDQVKSLTSINANLQKGLAAAESIFRLLDQPREEDAGAVDPGRVRGELAFERVRLVYPTKERPALDDVSFAVAPGETVALVGPSGAGKSSLVNLIPRFYAPSGGRVLLDGRDLSELRLDALRANIALVSQEVVLFNDTVAANIAYGPLAGAPRERVVAAARAAHASEFIEALPQGFDTVVGERGLRLSGGQRQRIAIARAVLKDAPILILDEATSALDSESERHVQAALEDLMRGRTTIVIAHRLSTIESAHRIVVLDAGRVVETGTHAELLALDGLYARLHRIQFAAAT